MPKFNERTPGIYRSTYLGCEERNFTNPDTNEEEPRWIWRFQEVADPTTAGVIDKITGTSLRSSVSNAHKMASGIVGRKLQAGDDTEAYIGRQYDVVYGPNQNGTLTITSVVPAYPGEDAGRAAKHPAETAPETAGAGSSTTASVVSDELPF